MEEKSVLAILLLSIMFVGISSHAVYSLLRWNSKRGKNSHERHDSAVQRNEANILGMDLKEK